MTAPIEKNVAQKPKGISVLRLGDHGENKRIWVVNKKLQQVFAPGEKVNISYDKKNKVITVKKVELLGGTHTISSRGNGIPVLDIKNREVANTLGEDIEKIEVLYFEEQIVIKVSKTEKFKAQRANKTGLNTFDLFCGGGTISSLFSDSGFNIIGGLELNEEYLALFHENNDGDEIYSISGRLEDIHTSYYPKNVDVVLAGIPCTTYSGSNVKMKKAQKAMREGREYDKAEIEKSYEAESLTFFVLTAIRAMNPRQVCIEEIPEYSESSASFMLRNVLSQMGYHITETVAQGTNTKRKRWVLVANMKEAIDLSDLVPETNRTIGDCLEIPVEEREWKPKEGFAPSRLNDSPKVGIRSCKPSDVMSNTFSTHGTRGTEPILEAEEGGLYSEFTGREIANIHGLSPDFILGHNKTLTRKILGQGVCNMFTFVSSRMRQGEYSIKISNGQRGELYGDEIIDFVHEYAAKRDLFYVANTIQEALDFLVSVDSRNRYFRVDKEGVSDGYMYDNSPIRQKASYVGLGNRTVDTSKNLDVVPY